MVAHAHLPDKSFAQIYAMRIFRLANLDPNHISLGLNLDDAIAEKITSYSNPTLLHIAQAYYGRLLFKKNVAQDFGEWIQGIMVQIVAFEIRQVVGTEPRFGTRYSSQSWIFLGGDLRHPTDLHFLKTRSRAPDDKYVEYWGRLDGSGVVVVYGPDRFSLIPYSKYDQVKPGAHDAEAFRRLELVLSTDKPRAR